MEDIPTPRRSKKRRPAKEHEIRPTDIRESDASLAFGKRKKRALPRPVTPSAFDAAEPPPELKTGGATRGGGDVSLVCRRTSPRYRTPFRDTSVRTGNRGGSIVCHSRSGSLPDAFATARSDHRGIESERARCGRIPAADIASDDIAGSGAGAGVAASSIATGANRQSKRNACRHQDCRSAAGEARFLRRIDLALYRGALPHACEA